MPAQGCMPVPEGETVVLATAKPGRHAWALEEVLDTVYPIDPDPRAEDAGFEGFIVVKVSAPPRRVSPRIKSSTYAFLSFITIAMVECEGASRSEVLEAVGRLASLARGERVRLRVKLRGEGKLVASRSLVEEAVRSAGARPSRDARLALVVESAGPRFYLTIGTTVPCGGSCTYVDPMRETNIFS